MPFSPRRLCHALALAVLASGALAPAWAASDHAPVPKPASAAEKTAEKPLEKAAEKPADKAAAAAKAEAPAEARKPAPKAPRDPMDVIRERLAEKLGNAKAAEPAGASVLRVVAKTPLETPDRPAAGGNAPGAVRLATAHRASRPALRAEPAHQEHAAHWDYQGAGAPEAWGQLKPEFAKCASGTRQSPIDIRDGIKVQLDPVQFTYRPSGFNVIDNGHTVQVNVGAGNSIEVMGRRFELVQFHFHRPSEERIDGRQFDMVAHLVHKDLEGRLAVVAVLLDRGSAHPIVQSVWNNLPLEKGETVTAKATLDLDALLPQDRRYFTYMGSLTTPPCSEGVLWMVMKQPVTISQEQIGIFARLYPMNARPIQQVAGRLIKESD